MGVDLGELIERKNIRLEDLSGKIIAIDAYNALYQYLSAIRQADGKPLMNRRGEITSHLSGLFYRTINLIEIGIKPVYVFDGKPPSLKQREIEKRKQIREEAEKKYIESLEAGEIEEARIYAQQASRLTDKMVEDAMKLLQYMGIPYVISKSEGEAQAAYLAMKNDAWAAASQDYDSLLFGSPRLVRNLTISGKRKLPRSEAYIEIQPELIILDEVLRKLKLTREQLIDIAILIGTDYNPEGFQGIGPKRAYSFITNYGNLKKALLSLKIQYKDYYDEIRNIFLNPQVETNYKLEWNLPNANKIIDFLCKENDFSEERILNALNRIKRSTIYAKGQKGLEAWFG
jgi:flap endonuclease-1